MNLTSGIVYAGFWRRFAAVIIDGFIVMPILVLLLYVVSGGELSQDALENDPFAHFDPLLSVAIDVSLFALVVFFWVRFLGTPGKLLMGCEIVNANTGEPLSIARAMLRYFAYLASALPLLLGFAWIAFDRRKQGLHDKIAGSLVIIADESRKSLQELEQELH